MIQQNHLFTYSVTNGVIVAYCSCKNWNTRRKIGHEKPEKVIDALRARWDREHASKVSS